MPYAVLALLIVVIAAMLGHDWWQSRRAAQRRQRRRQRHRRQAGAWWASQWIWRKRLPRLTHQPVPVERERPATDARTTRHENLS